MNREGEQRKSNFAGFFLECCVAWRGVTWEANAGWTIISLDCGSLLWAMSPPAMNHGALRAGAMFWIPSTSHKRRTCPASPERSTLPALQSPSRERERAREREERERERETERLKPWWREEKKKGRGETGVFSHPVKRRRLQGRGRWSHTHTHTHTHTHPRSSIMRFDVSALHTHTHTP